MTRPWFAIGWFLAWSLFQTFAVVSVLNGTWVQPEAFPDGAVYDSLIWPEVFFVPLYVAAAVLLWRRHWLGSVLALVAGGGIVYVMIYLLALSGLSGTVNLVADSLFLGCTLVSLWQVGAPTRQEIVFARARKAVRDIRSRAAETGAADLTQADVEREIKAAREARKQRARRG